MTTDIIGLSVSELVTAQQYPSNITSKLNSNCCSDTAHLGAFEFQSSQHKGCKVRILLTLLLEPIHSNVAPN